MKKTLIPLLFAFFCNIAIYGQTIDDYCNEWEEALLENINNADQLKVCWKFIKHAKPPCKIDIYIELGIVHYYEQQIDSSFFYFDKAIALGKKINEEELLSSAYSNKAYFLIEEDEDDKAKPFLKKARNLLKRYPTSPKWRDYLEARENIAIKALDYDAGMSYQDSILKIIKANNLNNDLPQYYHQIGYYQIKTSDYKSAIINFLQAIELKKKYNVLDDVSSSNFLLANCYSRLSQNETACIYYKEAIQNAKDEGNDFNVMLSYLRLGKSQRLLKQYKEASKAIEAASNIAKALNTTSQYAESLIEKGLLSYVYFKDNTKAEAHFKEAINTAKDALTLFYANQSLITLYFNTNSYSKAKPYLLNLKTLNKAVKTDYHTMSFHRDYATYLENTGQNEAAILNLKKYYKLKDSISSIDLKKEVADLEKKYDTKNKELEIANLNQEKNVQEKQIQEANFKRNLYLFSALLLAFLLLLGLWIYSKLRKQKKALAESNIKLAETNAIKNRLFSIISHDLRGMLIPFQRTGRIIKHHIDKNNTERAVEIATELDKNSQSLSSMLDNLLNWSLNQMNGYAPNPTQISINTELKNIIEGYKQQAIYKNTTINILTKEDITTYIDEGAFHVIFRNLIGNALKFTDNGTIRIDFKNQHNRLYFSVADTGVGMNETQVEKLFSLDDKKSTVGTQGEKGIGLGLNLVYRFVEMNKGTISVSSKERLGTKFEITFPILEALQDSNSKSLSA